MNVLKVIAVIIFALLVGALIWWGGWWLTAANRTMEYQVNRNSQQYQVALIDAERARAADWRRTNDPGQKAAIAATFCAVYTELKPPTPDLESDWYEICQ